MFTQPLLKVGIDHLWVGILRAVPNACTSSTAVLQPPRKLQQKVMQTPMAPHSSCTPLYRGWHRRGKPPADWRTCATISGWPHSSLTV